MPENKVDEINIPNIFPENLEQICVGSLLRHLLRCGASVEGLSSYPDYPRLSRKFIIAEEIAREYLKTYLSSHLLDSLTEISRSEWTSQSPGHLFVFAILCTDRTTKFVINESNDNAESWFRFLRTDSGIFTIINGLSRLKNLHSLTLHGVCTNEMLSVVSDACSKLTVLDISYSDNVTDVGLVYLCGGVFRGSIRGCKYLREIIFIQGDSLNNLISARVIAYILKSLSGLRVFDVKNLQEGLHYYNRNTFHRKPLNLVHYTGSDYRLLDVIKSCPKLKTFKLSVTSESLRDVGLIFRDPDVILERLTLSWTDDIGPTSSSLEPFLIACGSRISHLELEVSPEMDVNAEIFIMIGQHCRMLESLSSTHFRFLTRWAETDVVYFTGDLLFPFLTHLKLQGIDPSESSSPRNELLFLLKQCPELERLYLSFDSTAAFFDDFFLNDLLSVNPMNLLQEFLVHDTALTLISGLKLVSGRPKLRTLGKLSRWDVESGELDTFVHILRRAKSLNLLQDISIV